MNRTVFGILLTVQYLCAWAATDIFFGSGWLTALLLIGANILIVKLFCAVFLDRELDTIAEVAARVRCGALSLTAIQLLLIQGLRILLYYAI